MQDPAPTNGWCEILYERQAANLLLYGRALGLSHGEAEDVLQETFVALLKRPTAPGQPEFYALRAFRNRARNHRRSLWRRLRMELESANWFEPPREQSPAESAAVRHLAALPPEQREVLVLKLWHGLTFERIGELLELSPHTAASRYRYGLEKIRSHLRQLNDENPAFTGDPPVVLDTAPPQP